MFMLSHTFLDQKPANNKFLLIYDEDPNFEGEPEPISYGPVHTVVYKAA
jgi:hypothetical protein